MRPRTPRNYLNPEIMFAGGYAACFDNPIIGTLQIKRIKDVSHKMTVEVTLGELRRQQYRFEIIISIAFGGLDMEHPNKFSILPISYAPLFMKMLCNIASKESGVLKIFS